MQNSAILSLKRKEVSPAPQNTLKSLISHRNWRECVESRHQSAL